MTTYEECLGNLKSFINSLTYTDINYAFFYANDLMKPRIRSKFRQWSINNDKYYILQGVQENTVYVYNERHIKEIIENPTTNQGDYLEFQIYKTKNGGVLVRTHFIQFQDILEDNTYSRDNPKCNFTLSDDKVRNRTFDEFINLNTCDDVNGCALQRIKQNSEYPDYVMQCVFALTKVLINDTYEIEKSTKDNNKKLMTDEYIEFLTRRIFMNVVDVRKDLQTITVIYENGNQHICIIYDFEDSTRNILYFDV